MFCRTVSKGEEVQTEWRGQSVNIIIWRCREKRLINLSFHTASMLSVFMNLLKKYYSVFKFGIGMDTLYMCMPMIKAP